MCTGDQHDQSHNLDYSSTKVDCVTHLPYGLYYWKYPVILEYQVTDSMRWIFDSNNWVCSLKSDRTCCHCIRSDFSLKVDHRMLSRFWKEQIHSLPTICALLTQLPNQSTLSSVIGEWLPVSMWATCCWHWCVVKNTALVMMTAPEENRAHNQGNQGRNLARDMQSCLWLVDTCLIAETYFGDVWTSVWTQ